MSVKPGESRLLEFHTIWGRNFRNSSEPAAYAKRCDYNDYQPARKVCSYLMKHGSTEFADRNARNALACLSPETHLARDVALDSASFSLDVHEQRVTIAYYENVEAGGMTLGIRVEGY